MSSVCLLAVVEVQLRVCLGAPAPHYLLPRVMLYAPSGQGHGYTAVGLLVPNACGRLTTSLLVPQEAVDLGIAPDALNPFAVMATHVDCAADFGRWRQAPHGLQEDPK